VYHTSGRFSGRRYRFSKPSGAGRKPPVCLARRTSAAAFAASARVKDSCRWYQPLPRLPAIGCCEATPIGAPGRHLDRNLPVSALRARQAHLARRNRPRRRPQQGRTRRLTVSKALSFGGVAWRGNASPIRQRTPPIIGTGPCGHSEAGRKPPFACLAGPSAGRMHGLGVSRRLTPLASGPHAGAPMPLWGAPRAGHPASRRMCGRNRPRRPPRGRAGASRGPCSAPRCAAGASGRRGAGECSTPGSLEIGVAGRIA